MSEWLSPPAFAARDRLITATPGPVGERVEGRTAAR
jgi:hypothetical protein